LRRCTREVNLHRRITGTLFKDRAHDGVHSPRTHAILTGEVKVFRLAMAIAVLSALDASLIGAVARGRVVWRYETGG
jgi:hypothetical protein